MLKLLEKEMIWRLTEDPTLFPNPYNGEEDGLIAVGGDLSPKRLFYAYRNGIFPWYGFREHKDILWWCPLERFVIFPKEIHISHSMRQIIRKGEFKATHNKAFDKVIENCSKADERYSQVGAWLGEDMIQAYKNMFELGLAESVEVWDKNNNLIGGLYGICISNNFIGESMFSLVPNASKFALIYLAQKMSNHECIIDCQIETKHLKSMGGKYIPYNEYMVYMRKN